MQRKRATVSSLARQTGIERTALSKALSGQRTLPYTALDTLICHLQLTPSEEQTLRHYYEAQFEREGIYQSREMIGKLFADLASLSLSAPLFEKRQLLMDLEQFAGQHTVFSGSTNVQPLLRMVLTEELARPDARLELTVPPQDGFLTDELLRRYLEEQPTAEITQIIAFDSSGAAEDINLHNLDCFCRVLPACLLSQQHYHPYYYYDNSVSYTDPFPYYLVTHRCVVCLSGDGSRAMLLRSADQVDCYHLHFQTLLAQCHSLIQYTADPVAFLQLYAACTDPDGFYMVMDQPCFGRFYTDELIDRSIREELPFREELVQVAQQRFAVLRQGKHFYTLFTRSGLERFLATGTLDDFPVEMVHPFPSPDRRLLMRTLADRTRRGDVTARILEPGRFPDYLSMTTSTQSGVGFFATQRFPLAGGFCCIQLREPTLCRAFHGWLIHMSKSRHVLGGMETAEVLEQMALSSITGGKIR